MSAPEQVRDPYEELAHHKMREMAERLMGKPADVLLAQSAAALEEAAAELACVSALYAAPGGETDERWQRQIAQLTATAAALEQLADFGRRSGLENHNRERS